MRTLFLTLLLTLVMMLTGCSTEALIRMACSSEVTHPEGRSQTNTTPLTEPVDISISLSDDARARISDNLKFNRNHFKEAMTSAFDAKGLLAKDAVEPSYHLDVNLTEVQVRSSIAARFSSGGGGSEWISGPTPVSKKSSMTTTASSGITVIGGRSWVKDDRLRGRVTLIDADGLPLHDFDVSVVFDTGGTLSNIDEARLTCLYQRFSEEMMNELTGKPKSEAK